MSLKKDTLIAIFKSCQHNGDYQFDNNTVKRICAQTGFANPFDVTKVDRLDVLPDVIRNKGYCVVHLGKGRHCFMPAADIWYHKFEAIKPRETKEWDYKPSVLNHTDSSESNIISLVYNQKIIQKFLYGDITKNPKIYMSRRTKITTSYRAGTQRIDAEKLQVELDATFEHNGRVTVIEAKNGFHDNFAVYQIFLPFLDYQSKNIPGVKKVECCYLLQDKPRNIIRLYLYSFTDPEDIGSIQLIKKSEYLLKSGEP